MALKAIFALACAVASVTYAAKLVDPNKCPSGCKADTDCVLYSECRFLDSKDSCGFCVCGDGYKAQGAKCVPIKGYTTPTVRTLPPVTTGPTTTTTEATTTTAATTTTTATTTSTSPTTTGTTAQPAVPPPPDSINCPDYACSVAPPASNPDNNPLQVSSAVVSNNPTPGCKRQLVIPPRQCSMQGGGDCYGIYCLTVSPGNDYCICPYYKTDRQCAVDKPGSCDSATGQLPSGIGPIQGKRFRNPSNKDNGNVYGRHFSSSFNDCVKLCQWSQGQCRSVNYGQINGANVCEMLSVIATPKNLLASWLENASGWQYAQVTSS